MLVVCGVMSRHDIGSFFVVITAVSQLIEKIPDYGTDFIPAIVGHRAEHYSLVRGEGDDDRVALGLVVVGRGHPVAGLFLRSGRQTREVGKQNSAILLAILRIIQTMGYVGRSPNSCIHFVIEFARLETAGLT